MEGKQRFPRETLTRDERILFETNPHWVPFLLGSVIWNILLIIMMIAAIAYSPNFEIVVGMLFLWLILGLLPLLVAYLRWSHTVYAITNKRIMSRHGIIGRTIADCPHDKVQNTIMRQPVLQRLVGCGTIGFDTAGGGARSNPWLAMELMWIAVPTPVNTRRIVEEIIEKSKEEAERLKYQRMAAAMQQTGFTPSQPAPMQQPAQPAPMSPQAPAKYCTRCKATNPPNLKFCGQCGGPLG